MRQRQWRLAAAVVAATAAASIAVVGWFGQPVGQTRGSSPSPPAVGANMGHFERDGFAFDYPGSWRFYPTEMSASFFSTIGYLASQPIDVDHLCDRSANGVRCDLRGYDLAPGQIVVGLASWGVPNDPAEIWERPAEGRRIQVAGMPAIASEAASGPDRVVLTWKIARPDVINNWIQLDADLRGPGDAVLIAQANALVQSFRFEPPPVPLDPTRAIEIGNRALRGLRASEPEAYAGFPPVGGAVEAPVRAVPGMQLQQALAAICSTTISATDLGYWRMELTVRCGGDLASPEHRWTAVQWLRADGEPSMQSGAGDDLPFCCRP